MSSRKETDQSWQNSDEIWPSGLARMTEFQYVKETLWDSTACVVQQHPTQEEGTSSLRGRSREGLEMSTQNLPHQRMVEKRGLFNGRAIQQLKILALVIVEKFQRLMYVESCPRNWNTRPM